MVLIMTIITAIVCVLSWYIYRTCSKSIDRTQRIGWRVKELLKEYNDLQERYKNTYQRLRYCEREMYRQKRLLNKIINVNPYTRTSYPNRRWIRQDKLKEFKFKDENNNYIQL